MCQTLGGQVDRVARAYLPETQMKCTDKHRAWWEGWARPCDFVAVLPCASPGPVHPPDVMPFPCQGGLARRSRVDMRPLTELAFPSGILVCSVGFLSHSQCSQPILQTEAAVTGHSDSQPCLTQSPEHHQVHTHTHEQNGQQGKCGV